MTYLFVCIFGIIQGITEFLPVSSSGHLIILHEFINLPIENNLAFDVFLHFSSLLAVIYCFRKEIWQLIVSFLKSLRGEKDEYSKTAWLIILATIPAAFLGYFFDETIENFLHGSGNLEVVIVTFMLIAVGLLFILVEKYVKQGDAKFTDLNVKKASLIGFAQAMALIPGTSRSGITIIAGLSSGLKRQEALKFSFLMSIPIILGASITKVPDLFEQSLDKTYITLIALGFLSSFISAVLAIKYFLKFAREHSLSVFAYYRFALAFALVLYLLFS